MAGHLIIAIIQRRDLDELRQSLAEEGFAFTHVASYGGFLMESNDTLFIAVDEDKVEPVLDVIQRCCHSRSRYLSPISPMLETGGLFPPAPVEVQVGGAHVFIMPIEEYRRID